MPIITEAQLRKIAPHGKPNIIAAIAGQADRVFPKYGLTTLARVQIFVGLAIEETGGLTAITEDLQHYSAARIAQVWPSRFRTAAAAAPYANNAAGLADVVYGGRMGNAQPGDGYKYRGRGLIQVTGRSNYTMLAKMTGLDLVGNPDLALADEWLLECSVALFVQYPGILQACDAGNTTHVWNMVGGGAMNVAAHQQALAETRTAIPSLGQLAIPPAVPASKVAPPPPPVAKAIPPSPVAPPISIGPPATSSTATKVGIGAGILAVLAALGWSWFGGGSSSTKPQTPPQSQTPR